VLRRAAAQRSGPTPLRLALPPRLRPSRPGGTVFHLATSVSLPLFEVELAAVRAPGRRRAHQTDRARLGSRRLACERAAARARARPPALPAAVFARAPAR
jgi:hypothetical protein